MIPEDWDAPLLDSLAKRGSGHTPDKQHPEYWNGPIQWISLKDSDVLDRVYIEETSASITPAGIANSSAVIHPAGTVVLSRDAGVGKSAITKTPMAVSQHFMAWQCGPRLHNHFLYYWLQTSKPEFERIAMGNTIKTIGLPFFRSYRVPQPAIGEQRAIATALSDVDALLAKIDQLIAKKRDLKQAAMQQLLTGQTRLPGFSEEWEVKRLGDLFAFSGGHIASRDQLSGSGYCYLHYGDIHKSTKTYIDLEAEYLDIPKLTVRLSDVTPSAMLNDGDVVFVDASEDDDGTSRHVVVVNPLEKPYISGLHTIVAKARGDLLDNGFKRFCFQTRHIKQQFQFFAVGTKVSGISKTSIAKIELRFPSKAEQTAIASILSDMDAELASLEARRDKTRALKQGMMQALLTGRIRLAGGVNGKIGL
ncbi:restriction endonuclease subunit S [Acidovorax sp.]|uniref:restriction endonuclease subunit S n=1 Tax=Acidovorax sp. TaxID=1872122 RepID=UPI0027BA306B|nr:restriction endonuclease subunit S [Acidovorax sp.]